jgi:hypothetical protein
MAVIPDDIFIIYKFPTTLKMYYYYLFELQMGFTRLQWYYNKTQHKNTHITQNNTTLKQNTAHKAIQTLKDTLHTMNTTQQR